MNLYWKPNSFLVRELIKYFFYLWNRSPQCINKKKQVKDNILEPKLETKFI